tara:strand:+ start:64 stop:435 length:372 start_codon:yes stop_codon:yes gene_type:complete
MNDNEIVEEIKEGLIQFKDLMPETKAISEKVFHLFCEQFNNFKGFYKLDQMFDEYKLTDIQKHFLTSLFFYLLPTRESEEKNKKLKEMVKDTYKNLGYQKSELKDKDFNRKIHQYVMLTWKGI